MIIINSLSSSDFSSDRHYQLVMLTTREKKVSEHHYNSLSLPSSDDPW